MRYVLSIFLAMSLTHSTSWSTSLPTYEKVSLTCQNPLTPQTEGKTPIVTNNTAQNLGDAIRVFWASSDGDKGYFPGPLAISESKQGSGAPGSDYECEAFYYAEVTPD